MNSKKGKFLWGVVNIGQQTEGFVPSDWKRWAERGQVPEIGLANNYYEKHRLYHDLVSDLGCNAFRISIEWARIEPHENKFDQEAIAQYREILQDLKSKNITTVVGVWHWSVPRWFEDYYGMHKKNGVKKYENFVRCVRDELGDMIDQVVVLNEPNVFVLSSYVTGERPPFFKDRTKAFFVKRNLARIHNVTYHIWKGKYPDNSIGSTFLWNHEYGAHNTFLQNIYISVKQYCWVRWWIKQILNCSDYIGVNYYTSDGIFFGKSGGKWGVHGTNNWHDANVWKSFPSGLYHVLEQVCKYKKPIYILENGKPTVSGVDDEDRQEFLKQSIESVKKAVKNGVDVQGYFHYSLCDSYEWNSGYDFKFGLVEVDRSTLKRKKRKSFNVYTECIDKFSE